MSDDKISVNVEGLKALAEAAAHAGTLHHFSAVAIQWAEHATKRIREIEAEVERLTTAIREKGGTEHAPTQWAYDQACAALASSKAEVERLRAKMREWQSCAGCVGTFCKADALLERIAELEAEVERMQADWRSADAAATHWADKACEHLHELNTLRPQVEYLQQQNVAVYRGGLDRACEDEALLQQALEALEGAAPRNGQWEPYGDVISALRARLGERT